MKRVLLACLLVGCTANPVETGPEELYSGYFLSRVDDQALPVQTGEYPEGMILTGGFIGFLSGTVSHDSHGDRIVSGLVRRSSVVRPAGGGAETLQQIDLAYRFSQGILRIDLCPPEANCLVPAELVGPADTNHLELTLTLNGTARSSYRYHAALPD